MDDHAQKSINIGASVVIALVIIGVVITAVYAALRMANSGISQASKLSGQMQETTYTQYDGSIVKGDQVLALIKQFQDDTISIAVETGGSTVTKYIYESATFNESAATCSLSGDKMSATEFATAMREAQDPAESSYIAPTKNFICTVCRHPDTQGITGMYFELED
ncbi:MAG: hypothetical protein LUE86_01360 [Clostridiales bacterium]|nr:hypothetical protein [Clostridiales bacterium]